MKSIIKETLFVTAVTIAVLVGACNSSTNQSTTQTFNLDTTKLKSGETFYQCEMDTEVLSDQAGDCPKCGMELSEMKKQ